MLTTISFELTFTAETRIVIKLARVVVYCGFTFTTNKMEVLNKVLFFIQNEFSFIMDRMDKLDWFFLLMLLIVAFGIKEWLNPEEVDKDFEDF